MRNIYMSAALDIARQALLHGEVPVGCVIVRRGEIVAMSGNETERNGNPVHHAEINAIINACSAIGHSRLCECEMYVTLEPCPMCAGAIINARIPTLYYGARDYRMGAAGGVIDLFFESFGHHPAVIGGVMEKECRDILTEFFKGLREKGRQRTSD